MAFPIQRLRRLRSSEGLRRLVRETQLAPSQFIHPFFVVPGQGIRKEILSMPGNAQMSVDNIVRECEECRKLGLGGVILFGIPAHKDELASGAYDPDGVTQQAIRAIKKEVPGLLVMTDVCNCEYTSHGHCGKVVDGEVDNDATLDMREVKGIIGEKAFAAADTDQDGTLSKAEYMLLVQRLFKQADTDHDGTLDAKELTSKSGIMLKRLID